MADKSMSSKDAQFVSLCDMGMLLMVLQVLCVYVKGICLHAQCMLGVVF